MSKHHIYQALTAALAVGAGALLVAGQVAAGIATLALAFSVNTRHEMEDSKETFEMLMMAIFKTIAEGGKVKMVEMEAPDKVERAPE
jgi:hypothetical protein